MTNLTQEYDAIWLGGGAAGRFGLAFHKTLLIACLACSG